VLEGPRLAGDGVRGGWKALEGWGQPRRQDDRVVCDGRPLWQERCLRNMSPYRLPPLNCMQLVNPGEEREWRDDTSVVKLAMQITSRHSSTAPCSRRSMQTAPGPAATLAVAARPAAATRSTCHSLANQSRAILLATHDGFVKVECVFKAALHVARELTLEVLLSTGGALPLVSSSAEQGYPPALQRCCRG
jgi:hypothetical protein